MACAKVELSRQNRKAGATLSAMNKITQDMRFKQAVIEYSFKNGVTKAAIRYKTTRQNIYRWRKKYDIPFAPWQTVPIALTAIQTSTQRPSSSSSRICAAEILMQVWCCSGSNCASVAIPDPSPACISFCAESMGNHQTTKS